MNKITRNFFLLIVALILINPISAQINKPSIDGTYELINRRMADGTIIKAPAIKGLYTLYHGHFNLNIFIKEKNGKMSSESSIGRYTFNDHQYCEWIDYTIRNNLDSPGVTYKGPKVANHCAKVIETKDSFRYSPPGERVTIDFGFYGFTAVIKGEFTDHWKKVK